MGNAARASKYAHPEFERRFLLSTIPPGRVLRRRHIVDRYFLGTELRLRAVTSSEGDTEYKLTQKVRDRRHGTSGRITTMYLSPTAFRLLGELPGDELRKTRLSIPPFGIDIFEGALAGLLLAECEASSAVDLARCSPPSGTLAEVTEDERFTGGRLVTTTAEELGALLAPFAI